MQTMSINGKPYEILRLLGRGKGGYSYLVSDGTGQYVLKQIHHEPCDYYTFGNKIEAERCDYDRLMAAGIRIPRMLDIDTENERILKEYIDGPTVYQLALEDAVPQCCFDQVQQMCRKAYEAGLNIDYFPTNFVLQDGVLYYIDYECNGYTDEWNFENWGVRYWHPSEELLAYAREHP